MPPYFDEEPACSACDSFIFPFSSSPVKFIRECVNLLDATSTCDFVLDAGRSMGFSGNIGACRTVRQAMEVAKLDGELTLLQEEMEELHERCGKFLRKKELKPKSERDEEHVKTLLKDIAQIRDEMQKRIAEVSRFQGQKAPAADQTECNVCMSEVRNFCPSLQTNVEQSCEKAFEARDCFQLMPLGAKYKVLKCWKIENSVKTTRIVNQNKHDQRWLSTLEGQLESLNHRKNADGEKTESSKDKKIRAAEDCPDCAFKGNF